MPTFDRISVVGLGYVGLPTAATIAARGVRVHGVDLRQDVIDRVNNGRTHIIEPDLDIVVHSVVSTGMLKSSTKPEPADAFIIAVPTPVSSDNTPDMRAVESALAAIAPVIAKGNLIIIESTSPVGTTRRSAEYLHGLRPDLKFPDSAPERSDVLIAYCPERILPGNTLRELGRPEEALADFQAGGAHMLRGECPSPSAAPWRSGAALAQLALGDPDAARSSAAEEVELARELGAPRALGVALRAQGLVSGGSEGLAMLEASVGALEQSQASLELAKSLAELGGALRRCGRRGDARKPLRRALELATHCGADPLADQVRTELRASGARPRQAALSGPQSLTVSERRVAEMAAQGQTNREIAQALFVSLRTIETHLTHAFQKLGIDSRTRLAAALEETTS